MSYHSSKNDDPNGCPDQVMGDCAYACAYCGRDGDAEMDRLRARVAELEEENAAQRRTEEQRLSQRIDLLRAALDSAPAVEETS